MRRLLPWRRPPPAASRPDLADVDPFASRDPPAEAPADALAPLLAQIEAEALAVYRDHGLPVRPGHYRRGPRSGRWTHLGDRLDAEARWALALDKPPERGWRYARLDELGRIDGRAGPAEAARLLAGCAALKNRDDPDRTPAERLALAVRLGADWTVLRQGRARATSSRLTLTAPTRASPARAAPRKP